MALRYMAYFNVQDDGDRSYVAGSDVSAFVALRRVCALAFEGCGARPSEGHIVVFCGRRQSDVRVWDRGVERVLTFDEDEFDGSDRRVS